MTQTFPLTVIVRSPKERKKRCSVAPLKGRPGILVLTVPVRAKLPPLDGYIRLSAEGLPLTAADAGAGILLLDSSWRRVDALMRPFLDVPPRSLTGYVTAFPRASRDDTDPDNGLASVEALYLAYHILGRPTEGLLDHYRWAAEFLAVNGLAPAQEREA